MSTAPGRLEQVRRFLNTWRLPHDTRLPVDDLPALAAVAKRWQGHLPDVPPPDAAGLPALLELRAALRDLLGQPRPVGLASWLEQEPLLVQITGESERAPVSHVPVHHTTAGHLLAIVIDEIQTGRWPRLKACPDCRTVFYDHSRNASRTWCGMYAQGPEGRACGSIAKVRSYRARRRGDASPPRSNR